MKTSGKPHATAVPANDSAIAKKGHSVTALSRNLPGVTARQLQILQNIDSVTRKTGVAPTFQEIGDAFGVSKVTVFEHVEALIRKGYLRRGMSHGARQLKVIFVPEVAHAG